VRQRSISAVGIVVLGLLPALLGGPIFVIAFTLIVLQSYRELTAMLRIEPRALSGMGYGFIATAGVLTWWEPDGRYLPLVVSLTVLTPLVVIVFRQTQPVDQRDWTTAIGPTLYLLLPTFAAIALRGTTGSVERAWFADLAGAMPFDGDTTAKGLGWFLTALLITWLSDTAAYLVGKSVGRTKLIPRVSPNKTVEGAAGGLVAAGITATVCVFAFGLDVHPLTALIMGTVLGIVGMLGDLSESTLKRRAGVKDSGNLIPGHGGMLDRIDALIFVLTATWALLPLLP
jgi:phosphatidate cytidylyltransferase